MLPRKRCRPPWSWRSAASRNAGSATRGSAWYAQPVEAPGRGPAEVGGQQPAKRGHTTSRPDPGRLISNWPQLSGVPHPGPRTLPPVLPSPACALLSAGLRSPETRFKETAPEGQQAGGGPSAAMETSSHPHRKPRYRRPRRTSRPRQPARACRRYVPHHPGTGGPRRTDDTTRDLWARGREFCPYRGESSQRLSRKVGTPRRARARQPATCHQREPLAAPTPCPVSVSVRGPATGGARTRYVPLASALLCGSKVPDPTSQRANQAAQRANQAAQRKVLTSTPPLLRPLGLILLTRHVQSRSFSSIPHRMRAASLLPRCTSLNMRRFSAAWWDDGVE